MKFEPREARDIVYNNHGDWEKIESEIVEHTRWSVCHEGIFRHTPTGKHYSFHWSVGATEQQDEQAFEYDKVVVAIEVVKKEVTVTQWVAAGA